MTAWAKHQRVALRRDVEEHRLKKRDVAMLVDRVPHPSGGEPGVVLEVFNAMGESIAVVAVKESDIEPLRADEVLTVRPLVSVGSSFSSGCNEESGGRFLTQDDGGIDRSAGS
jgi:hypothetical protein